MAIVGYIQINDHTVNQEAEKECLGLKQHSRENYHLWLGPQGPENTPQG